MDHREKAVFTDLLLLENKLDYLLLDAQIELLYSRTDYSDIPDWIRMYTESDNKNNALNESIEDIIATFLTKTGDE